MDITVHRFGTRMVNRYLVGGAQWIVVDAGPPYVGPAILRRTLARLGILPGDIRLILLTHGHVDHAGAAAAAKLLTGAPVAIHRGDQLLLKEGRVVMPPMWSTLGAVLRALLVPIVACLRFPRVCPDIVLDGEGLRLDDFALCGRWIHTPGHTQGSVSLLLDSGEAFVGDLLVASRDGGATSKLPPAGDSREQMLASVNRLLSAGATMIFPGHGPAFPAEHARSVLVRGLEAD
jgi:glyoxylase-like metal-dependent hydrolase (beta-lactamase superfamily II)